ncbi:MAG: hypothetical protein IPL40_01130 [Proteobacteria bacterium]|nr:hypothetical protein [Pseudomonadota bacterium]
MTRVGGAQSCRVLERRRPAGQAMLVALLALGLLALRTGTAGANDRAWGRDKALHLTVGLAIGSGCYGLLWAAAADRAPTRLALCATLGLLPGLGKELYDAGQPNNRFSLLDLAWTTVGVVGASFALWGIERAVEPRSASRAR